MNSTADEADDGTKGREGGIFYPTGHALLAFEKAEYADQAMQRLRHGYSDDGAIARISAGELEAQAVAEIENPGLLAGFGSTLATREQQLRLAREGAEFILVKVGGEEETEALLQLLGDIPIRYGARYGRLVIENLIGKACVVAVDAKSSTAD